MVNRVSSHFPKDGHSATENRTRNSMNTHKVKRHGENGLDPITCVNLYRTFILPILTYGLDVLLPSQSSIKKVEQFQNNC